MNDTTALWDRVCKTDPAAVKPITGKQYQGNSPKPYYIVRRLTEEFGPCGLGWGFNVVNERFERFSDTDTLHVALVEFWYLRDGIEEGRFQQMGQTKASYMSGQGKFILDEDAPKKSVTDALVKCASYLGFAGDIFSGRWDDSKYVAELKKEFSPPPADLVPALEASIEQAKQKRQGVMGAVLAGLDLSAEVVAGLGRLAEEVKSAGLDRDAPHAFDLIDEQGLNNDERVYLWSLLPSPVRSALKREGQIRSLTKETA